MTEVKYLAMDFWECDRSYIMELRDMDESMKIIERMTAKYQVSFHLILGNDDEVATIDKFRDVLKERRHDKSTHVLIQCIPRVLVNIINSYEF